MEVIYLIKEALVFDVTKDPDWFVIYAVKDYNKMLENLRRLENESITNERGYKHTGIFRYEEITLWND